MITLYQPPGAWGIPSVSPFCVKLETWLRMTGLPYQVRHADPTRAPKGKFPFIEHEGRKLGDSQLIVQHLTRTFGVTLDAALSDDERARGHVARRMLEEGTYWSLVHARWVVDSGWAHTRPVFLTILPPVIGGVILPFVRRSVRSSLQAQGTGRHSAEDVVDMGIADVDALAVLLGDRPFFLGAEPTSVDATVYAFVCGILAFPDESRIRAATAGHANLVAYRARMEARFWSTQ